MSDALFGEIYWVLYLLYWVWGLGFALWAPVPNSLNLSDEYGLDCALPQTAYSIGQCGAPMSWLTLVRISLSRSTGFLDCKILVVRLFELPALSTARLVTVTLGLLNFLPIDAFLTFSASFFPASSISYIIFWRYSSFVDARNFASFSIFASERSSMKTLFIIFNSCKMPAVLGEPTLELSLLGDYSVELALLIF